MSKGQVTRRAILDDAVQVVSRLGFDGLSIGSLADQAGMSKSGLFAHFRSKEQLQLQTLEHARQKFIDVVVRPALASPNGEKRLCALFEHWRRWDHEALAGGCLFIAAAVELDDQPGPLRDALVRSEWEWLGLLAAVASSAVAKGEFRNGLDVEQFAFEVHGLMLSHHYASRLLLDAPAAAQRTSVALQRLLADARGRRPA